MKMDLISNTVSKTGNTLGKGAGLFGKTALNIGRTASNAATSAATNAGTAVGKGGAAMGRMGVDAAGAVGKTAMVGATMGVTAVTTGAKVVTRQSSGGRGTARRQHSGDITEMDIFCSDFYTEQFVLEEMDKARKDPNITTLKFEDMILRESPKLFQAAIGLLRDTATSAIDMAVEEEEGDGSDLDTSWRSMNSRSRGRKNIGGGQPMMQQQQSNLRIWKEVAFVDAISDALDYQVFVKAMNGFQKKLRLKNLTSVPIKFKAKIELHTMMPVEEVLKLLMELEQDTTITRVDFPTLSRNIKKIPKEFLRNFDVDAQEWKEDANSIEIYLRYGSQDMMSEMGNNSAFGLDMSAKEEDITPNDIIRCCRRRLDKTAKKKKDRSKSPAIDDSSRRGISSSRRNNSFSWTEDNSNRDFEDPTPVMRKKSSGGGSPKSPRKRPSGDKFPTDSPRRISSNSSSSKPTPGKRAPRESFVWDESNRILQDEGVVPPKRASEPAARKGRALSPKRNSEMPRTTPKKKPSKDNKPRAVSLNGSPPKRSSKGVPKALSQNDAPRSSAGATMLASRRPFPTNEPRETNEAPGSPPKRPSGGKSMPKKKPSSTKRPASRNSGQIRTG